MRFPLAQLVGFLAAGFLLVALGYPLLVILARSWGGWAAVGEVLASPYYLGRLGFTTFQALLSTLLTLLLGLPGAALFARYRFPGKRLIRTAFTIPFVMPTVVAAIGFLALVGPRGLTGVDLRGTLAVILMAHVFYNYAIVVRVVSGYLEGFGVRPREAAAVLGAGPWHTFWRVTLPIAWPAALAAAALVFIFSFTSFGVILILAPEARFATLEVEIYRLSTRLFELEAAAVLALAQLLVVSAFTLLYTRLQARLALSAPASRPPLPRPRGFWARLALGLNLLLAALLVLSPLVALGVQTFWVAGAWSLEHFRAALAAPRTLGFAGAWPALLNSLRFAATSTALSLLAGFAFAYAVVRGRWRWLDAASLLPLATSAVTLGLGYLIAFPELRGTLWSVALAHTLLAFPFVTRSLLPALRALPKSALESAAVLGVRPLAILWRVELPLLAPAFVTASSFAFAISMGEFGATLTLLPAQYATLPVAIFDRLGRPGAQNYGAALALAFVLMVVTGAVMLLLERFGKTEL